MRALIASLACAALACSGAGNSATESKAPAAPADNGLVVRDSANDVATTVSKLEAAITAKGLRVFVRIDHAANAKAAGLELPPTVVVVFGKPQVGTKLMQASRTVAIDLPQKMLVWQEGSAVKIAYNAPAYLGRRHGIDSPVLGKVAGLLAQLAETAAR